MKPAQRGKNSVAKLLLAEAKDRGGSTGDFPGNWCKTNLCLEYVSTFPLVVVIVLLFVTLTQKY